MQKTKNVPKGLKQKSAQIVAKQIDKYIVHLPSEVRTYAQYHFIVSMGPAQRDYKTLIEADDKLQIPTVIVT
jgi:hypothetical protein